MMDQASSGYLPKLLAEHACLDNVKTFSFSSHTFNPSHSSGRVCDIKETVRSCLSLHLAIWHRGMEPHSSVDTYSVCDLGPNRFDDGNQIFHGKTPTRICPESDPRSPDPAGVSYTTSITGVQRYVPEKPYKTKHTAFNECCHLRTALTHSMYGSYGQNRTSAGELEHLRQRQHIPLSF